MFSYPRPPPAYRERERDILRVVSYQIPSFHQQNIYKPKPLTYLRLTIFYKTTLYVRYAAVLWLSSNSVFSPNFENICKTYHRAITLVLRLWIRQRFQYFKPMSIKVLWISFTLVINYSVYASVRGHGFIHEFIDMRTKRPRGHAFCVKCVNWRPFTRN